MRPRIDKVSSNNCFGASLREWIMMNPRRLGWIAARAMLVGAMCLSSIQAQAINLIFEDYQFSFQLLRTLGYAVTGGADIAESLGTARRIEPGNAESWHKEWKATAKRLENAADGFLAAGHEASAREAYLRASNYYRNAEFFLHSNPDDPRTLETWARSRETFLEAAKLMAHPVRPIRIPYEQTTLPGYLLLVDDAPVQRPLLIVHSGFDGTAEELYLEIGALAVARGYNCLLFEGPGQGEVIRRQKIPFRHDWESVVTPVVDYALTLPQVDPERIGLMGISFGGYLAPRAAAFEHRLKVVVANGGIYDFYANVLKKSPPDTEQILENEQAAADFDQAISGLLKTDVDTGWFFANGMFTFGADTPSGLIRMLRPYNLREVAPRISSKILVVDSEGDQDLPGQAKQLYDALSAPKHYMLFTKEEGAEEHCQMGATMISGERILNWLDEQLM